MVHLRKLLLATAIGLGTGTFGTSCAEDAADPSAANQNQGVLQLRLGATSASGQAYRLRQGTITITGPISQTISCEDSLTTPSVTRTLPVGQYAVALIGAWSLERQTATGYDPVVAELISANPMDVIISANAVAHAEFRFRVGQEVINPPEGNLSVGIEVEEVETGGSGPSGGTAGTGGTAGNDGGTGGTSEPANAGGTAGMGETAGGGGSAPGGVPAVGEPCPSGVCPEGARCVDGLCLHIVDVGLSCAGCMPYNGYCSVFEDHTLCPYFCVCPEDQYCGDDIYTGDMRCIGPYAIGRCDRGMPCGPGTGCDFGYVYGPPSCVETSGGPYEVCPGIEPCQQGLDCIGWTCEANHGEGSPCWYYEILGPNTNTWNDVGDCQSGLYCSIHLGGPGTCRRPGGLGETCYWEYVYYEIKPNCETGAYCAYDWSLDRGTCMLSGNLWDPCYEPVIGSYDSILIRSCVDGLHCALMNGSNVCVPTGPAPSGERCYPYEAAFWFYKEHPEWINGAPPPCQEGFTCTAQGEEFRCLATP